MFYVTTSSAFTVKFGMATRWFYVSTFDRKGTYTYQVTDRDGVVEFTADSRWTSASGSFGSLSSSDEVRDVHAAAVAHVEDLMRQAEWVTDDVVAAICNTVGCGVTGYTPGFLVDREEWVIGGLTGSLKITVTPDMTPNDTVSAARPEILSWIGAWTDAERGEASLTLREMGEIGIGSWVSGDQELTLDVCDTREDETTALAVAAGRGELAIWHPVHGERTV